MGFFWNIYYASLFDPLFNTLLWLHAVLPWRDIGITIIVFTIIIRFFLTPIFYKAQKSQKDMSRIQPELKKIQEKFKNDREAQAKATMELYTTHGVNPFTGCLMLLIQLPLLLALFHVFRAVFDPVYVSHLYAFVPHIEHIDPFFLGGLLDLSKGSLYLGIVAGITQYFQMKLVTPPLTPLKEGEKADFARIMQSQSLYIFPVMLVVFSQSFPGTLTLYWTVLNLFGIVQELFVNWRERRRFQTLLLHNAVKK